MLELTNQDNVFKWNISSALQEDKSASEWPTKNDDFFPYASDEHGYWTGYFTSRPTSKRMIRESSGVLNSAKQLISKVHFYR